MATTKQPVAPSSGSSLQQMSWSYPERQQPPTCRSLEACCQSWSRQSDVMALAG